MKKVFLLIGLKGSGKSFIGKLMEEEFDIKFIRVEDWAKEIKRERQVDDTSYVKEVFHTIENGVREALQANDKIAFESTGLSESFDQMLASLQRDFIVTTIGVQANDDTCIKRVRTRDQSIHVNVSDEQVAMMNKLVKEKNLKTDHIITNEDRPREELIAELKSMIK